MICSCREKGERGFFIFLKGNSEGTLVDYKFNPRIAFSIHILSSSLKKGGVGFLFSSSWSSAQVVKARHPAYLV